MSGKARQIEPKFVPKVWGSRELAPWFANAAEPIGEVWFPADELLIKFLFTTENLSVQVHPEDEYAARHEQSRGKTEMWHILRAVPGATVAFGFKKPIAPEVFQKTAESGEIVDYLNWVPANAGDTFFTPAGTVHAIGGGLALCEIQQNSDVTYRVFDYGRGRGLHLQRASEVSKLGPHPGATPPKSIGSGSELLAECRYFVTERLQFNAAREILGGYAVMLQGAGKVDGQSFRAGTVWALEDAGSRIEPEGSVVLLLTRVPVS